MKHKFQFKIWVKETPEITNIRHIGVWLLLTHHAPSFKEYMDVNDKITEHIRGIDIHSTFRLHESHDYFISGTGTATISYGTITEFNFDLCSTVKIYEKTDNQTFVVESIQFKNIKNIKNTDDEEFQPKFVVESVQFEDIENTGNDEEFQDQFAQAFQKAHDEEIDDEETYEETKDRIKQYTQDIRKAYAKDTAQPTIQQIKELVSQEITNNNYQIKELVTREITNNNYQKTHTTSILIAVIAIIITAATYTLYLLTLLHYKK